MERLRERGRKKRNIRWGEDAGKGGFSIEGIPIWKEDILDFQKLDRNPFLARNVVFYRNIGISLEYAGRTRDTNEFI